MLGQDLVKIFERQGFNILPTDIDTLNITDELAVKSFLSKNKTDFIIHAAAYTNVDGAESDKDTAFLVNQKGTENLSRYSSKMKIPILYISTDYVFDGTKNTPYEPSDITNPLNIYGLSKLKGELAVQKDNPMHYIVRTSWLYGHNGKNFVETMINLSQQRPELKVINDQIGCPTWTVALANAILYLIKENKPYGIYHACGSSFTSWHGFASRIMEIMKINIKVLPISTEEYPTPAKRPKYSVMNNNQICPGWEESLECYIKARKNI